MGNLSYETSQKSTLIDEVADYGTGFHCKALRDCTVVTVLGFHHVAAQIFGDQAVETVGWCGQGCRFHSCIRNKHGKL